MEQHVFPQDCFKIIQYLSQLKNTLNILILMFYNIKYLLKNRLKANINVLDYAHICSIFLISNDKILTKQKVIQDRKIIGLIKGKGKGIDPENVILQLFILCAFR